MYSFDYKQRVEENELNEDELLFVSGRFSLRKRINWKEREKEREKSLSICSGPSVVFGWSNCVRPNSTTNSFTLEEFELKREGKDWNQRVWVGKAVFKKKKRRKSMLTSMLFACWLNVFLKRKSIKKKKKNERRKQKQVCF